MKLLRIVLICWAVLGLTTVGCETKKDEAADTAKGGEKGGEGGEKTGEQGPEEDLLTAMKTVGELLNENMDDADAAIAAVSKYVTDNEERLQKVVEAVRTKGDAMSAEEQDAFYESNTKREEYQLWDGAMLRFERTYPERYGDLEEITDTIQSAGTEDLIEEATTVDVDVAQQLAEADTEYGKLDAMTFDGVSKDDLATRFEEISSQAAKVEALYHSAFQNTADAGTGVTALVKAGDLYVLVAKKVRGVETVEGIEAADLSARVEAAAAPLEGKAAALYGTALDKAKAENIQNDAVTRAEAALTDGGITDNENDVPAPEGDAPAPEGDAPAPEGDAPAPEGDAPAPEGDAPAPEGDAPAPEGDAPAPG